MLGGSCPCGHCLRVFMRQTAWRGNNSGCITTNASPGTMDELSLLEQTITPEVRVGDHKQLRQHMIYWQKCSSPGLCSVYIKTHSRQDGFIHDIWYIWLKHECLLPINQCSSEQNKIMYAFISYRQLIYIHPLYGKNPNGFSK